MKIDYKNQIELYKNLINTYGNNFKCVNWGSEESQRTRFEYLIKDFELDSKSLLDVGCGRGDLLEYVQVRNIDLFYEGVDITPEMVKLCKDRFPGTSFKESDVFSIDKNFDYIVASGIFYLMKDSPLEYMKNSIKFMWEKCNIGISFNSLSLWAINSEKDIFYSNPQDIISFCKEMTTKINFYHSYHPRDYTIVMFK